MLYEAARRRPISAVCDLFSPKLLAVNFQSGPLCVVVIFTPEKKLFQLAGLTAEVGKSM
jgi:hypothetical protein